MRGAGGALAVAVAALLVSCNADPQQEQDGSVGDHSSSDRYDVNEYKQREELQDFIRFLSQYERLGERNTLGGLGGNTLLGRNINGIGGNTLLGRNLDGLGGSTLLGRNLGGLGGSTLLGRNLNGIGGNTLVGRNLDSIGGSSLLGRNLNGIGGSTLLGREIGGQRYSRFVDSLGGGNLVRSLDSIGGGNLVRNLDSLGGGNLVKKNLDQLGGPNLIKRTLDSLGGGNLVRNLDSLGGGNFVRQLDSLGGGHKTRNLDPLGGGNLIRDVRETRHSLLPYLLARRYEGAYGGARRDAWPMTASEYYDGLPKRNFDEIDRSDLDSFVRKRNFDEIDQTSMPFPYAIKRFYHLYGYNHHYAPVSNIDKKRLYRPDYPMDEIDLSHFPIGSKRSMDNFPLVPRA